ncbi:hypothetical protein E1263_42195 [Kribbella antibiotica]|uniref:Uncharacterized protein n=1 Tax=Kribbella antibiotica TaxID=190195 RepID=A0A4R4YEZ8_9ACTN|nr:hypothetical protein [Kribbella antibiotica]TDD42419.1 hypothetical protein E1263_42195 [Kribbella antibiotica]
MTPSRTLDQLAEGDPGEAPRALGGVSAVLSRVSRADLQTDLVTGLRLIIEAYTLEEAAGNTDPMPTSA